MAWIVLFEPPLCIDMAMLKAAQKYVGLLSQCSALVGMARKLEWVGNKSVQVGIQVIQPSF